MVAESQLLLPTGLMIPQVVAELSLEHRNTQMGPELLTAD